MDVDSRSPSPGQQEDDHGIADEAENTNAPTLSGEGPFTVDAAIRIYQERGMRNRSPTPPRALYRSTTGKGVAFTNDDIAFLCKFLAHRKFVLDLVILTRTMDTNLFADYRGARTWSAFGKMSQRKHHITLVLHG